ncbi:peptidylprolyl isomerase [Congregibacter litoralis]|uniref:Chaperone SurA n=1 Tax=Congregibacter litoralis KT71 TaxID=314285 RepID=A4A6U9_9GAMM|nr:peptidylprolyl isomerase [Congregibacter litoralis]EAQ98018.2 periplasmic chaperone for outer membrane protein SurA [Congregibacter litoralis KT71]
MHTDDRTFLQGNLWLSPLLALLLALLLATGPTSVAQAATEMLDQVVAVVDDDVVMASELRERMAAVNQNIAAQGAEAPPEDVLIRETLDRLILENIQIQMGQRFGVRISDAQLNQAMGRIAAQNGLTQEQFAVLLEQEGRSYMEIRENIEREMIIQRVQQGNVNQLIEISDQEIENYLSTEEGQKLVQPEYRIIHALLPISSDTSDAEIEKNRTFSEGLVERIRDGESFEAVMTSVPQEYAFTGGDLGWRKLADLPSLFQEVAPTLSRGETADVFQSPSGLHIVTMADQRGGGDMTINQTKVRHILIEPSEILTDDQARDLAAELRERVEAGEDFGDLAREYSEDIGSAAEGGDLGWTSPGQMVPEFENMMASTEVGVVSPPVRSQFGWHILEVLERREKDITEDMRKAQVREFLHGRKYQEELDAWLRKIRDEAFVDIK